MPDLVGYALDHLNAGKDPKSTKTTDRLFLAHEVTAVAASDHVDDDGKLKPEVRVTVNSTGSIFYLPLPAKDAEPAYAVAADDDADGDGLDELKLPALKTLAGELGLAKTGTRPQLIANIRAYQAAE